MLDSIFVLNLLMPVLYLVTLLAYSADFFKERKNLENSKRIFLLVTLFSHLIYLMLRVIEFQHAPITNKFELFTLLAFTIGFAYFVLELLTDVRGTGLFIILFSFIFQVFSSFFIENIYEVKEILRNPLLGIHVTSAIVGHSGVTLSAVYGVLFLMLYKKIKTRNYGLIFNKLPNLEILEKLSFYSIVIGYTMLTVAILIGTVWLPTAFPDFNHFDPKIVSTLIIWIIYTGGICAKLFFKWYGKKVIVFSLIGFVIVIVSMVSTIIITTSFHQFQ